MSESDRDALVQPDVTGRRYCIKRRESQSATVDPDSAGKLVGGSSQD
jgi:hypothetical protein